MLRRTVPALAALGLPLLVPASLPLYAVEGLAEDLTVFSLLLLGGMGVLRRCAWCGTAAFLLTMEELNWFQPWLGFPTPPGSRPSPAKADRPTTTTSRAWTCSGAGCPCR